MKNNWMPAIRGYVRLRIEGKYPERFLNRCIESGVEIWNIKRVGDERIVCFMELEDVHRIRPLLRVTNCKVTFTARRGLPFFMKKVIKRSGFVTGITGFFIVMFILSNMVWNIEIKGASPQVELELRQVVEEMGIKRGRFQFSLPSVELIQRNVTEQVSGATWVGVRQKGTTYEFEVVEQKLPEEAEKHSPRHLIAKKKAIIHDIYVEHGQAQVKPNDFVQKGDMLVSGFIGKEGKTEIVPAEAKVLGEIWYKSNVTVPLESVFTTLTGEKKTKHYITFGHIAIPIWGFGKNKFSEYEAFEQKKAFQLLKWSLPVHYKRIEIQETSNYNRTYKKEEAIEAAKEMARHELKGRVPLDAEIIGEKVLHEAVENGKVKLQIHYQVIEDITSEQPIIQGD
ncbi:sporulation protein YqfD [Halalkalibacter urbisdiaboli]|uniref:sporulation protein YqfD n=1 Tax=Halalkalibacter urbisdiaboli TaxID=1960589 RepID=UPI000B447E71|nr:sporulation protein YqfD [Halalkalibacter urbisdiaboli]